MLNPREKIVGCRIILQRAEKTFQQAQISLAEIKNSLAELKPWLDWAHDDYGVEDAYEYLLLCDTGWTSGKEFDFALKNSAGEFIGMISAQNVNENAESVEIGYWISTRFCGKGYMQEAVSLLEKELFGLGINRIVIKTDVLNVRSANVAQKRGYVLEGVLRQESFSKNEQRFRDINVFSKLKKEFEYE